MIVIPVFIWVVGAVYVPIFGPFLNSIETWGVAIIIAVLTRSTQSTRNFLVEFINPVRELLYGSGLPIYWQTESLRGLTALNLEVNHQAMLVGFQNSFMIMMIVPAVGIILTLLLGKPKTS